jgi:hypothetical protein
VATALTSWKEIAAYLHKALRTVQRWEQQAGLPVRRPRHDDRGPVFAVQEELDAWLLSRPHHNGHGLTSQVKQLSNMVAKLQHENATLRRQLLLAKESLRFAKDTKPVETPYNPLQQKSSPPANLNTDASPGKAEPSEMSRSIRVLRALPHHSSYHRQPFQPQVSAMLTWCAIAEDDLVHGRIEQARRLVRKLRWICGSIQLWLNDDPLRNVQTHPLQEQLTEIQTRIASIESRLPPGCSEFTPACERV